MTIDNNALISIQGRHFFDDETSDEMEIIMPGVYSPSDSGYIITYCETGEDTLECIQTTVTVGDRKITVDREGEMPSRMIFEQGKKHLVHYDTQFGALTVGVSASKVKYDLSESGGDISVDYSIEIDSAVASENVFKLNVKRAKNELEGYGQ